MQPSVVDLSIEWGATLVPGAPTPPDHTRTTLVEPFIGSQSCEPIFDTTVGELVCLRLRVFFVNVLALLQPMLGPYVWCLTVGLIRQVPMHAHPLQLTESPYPQPGWRCDLCSAETLVHPSRVVRGHTAESAGS